MCSQAHILCSCPSTDSLRRDQLYSIRGANNWVPEDPHRRHVAQYTLMANRPTSGCSLWTGMLTKAHRTSLHHFVGALSRTIASALLLGLGCSFAWATRALSETFSTLISPSNQENSSDDEDPHDHLPALPMRVTVILRTYGLALRQRRQVPRTQVTGFVFVKKTPPVHLFGWVACCCIGLAFTAQ